ncbi:MAG: DNA-3-methyladenine glycosylase [Myxococcota bacterium]
MAPETEGAPLTLAKGMLGGVLSKGGVSLRVVEVEAYGDAQDSASHARFGRTNRTWPMFEAEGGLYVYLCYGIHWMVNVAAGPEGQGGAVLVRGAEVVRGRGLVRNRRGRDPSMAGALAGPGKVGQALAASKEDSGRRLGEGLWRFQRATTSPGSWRAGPRIGIGYAADKDQVRRWRLWLPSGQVSPCPRV